MSDKVIWGIIGNAAIARICVLPAIQKSRNGIVHALASRDIDKATAVAKQHGIEKVYSGYEDLVADPEIDAIYIPLPNHLHHPWSLAALAAGKHVLCEKPLACNSQQAQEMAAAAATADRLIMEAFMYRFHPRTQCIQKLIQEGAIGIPRLIRSAFCYTMDAADFQNADNARLRPEMGGGALMDVGCYGVSLARWLFGTEPTLVQCRAAYHSQGVDVHTIGMLDFDDGRLATVEASMTAGLQQTYTVVGENGVIELPHNAFIPWEKDAAYTLREKDAEAAAPTVVPGADEYQLMVEHFGDAVQGREELAFPISDSIANMRVMDALAQAARTGKSIVPAKV